MKTITIQIGNSDDKLTQAEWASFVRTMRSSILDSAHTVHFFGAPMNWENWQNAAWVIAIEEDRIPILKQEIIKVRQEFKQDSVAWTEGETLFV